MPRASSTAKRQQGAPNHRDTRHENGLVGPGKRVQKQKSNGHLNGHVKPSDSSQTSTPPPSATPPPPTNGHATRPLSADLSTDSKVAADALRRTSEGTFSESSSSDSHSHAMSYENHRRIDVNAAKNPAVHRDLGSLSFALTVLRSCPLYDTIAILIVLLQIPPTFLSIIHFMFALLTFVPSAGSATSGISIVDIFSTDFATPSLATIVVVDLIVLLIWLFLWAPLQDIMLDLGQTVIALTLGGGTAGKDAGMHNVLVCFGIVGLTHCWRGGHGKQASLRSILSSSSSLTDPDDPLESAGLTQYDSRKGAGSIVRSILAIHILTQGVVRYIRDWYVRRERRDHSVSVGDPEAAKGGTDTTNETPKTQTPENEPASPSPLSSAVVAKKRKKDSAKVRTRQPLWSALASTKIVMVKEYETSHAAVESAGTNATDINNLGNAPFDTEASRIWVTYVGSDTVFFATSYFPTFESPSDSKEPSLNTTGFDKSKPFFVKVNNTVWQPTRINKKEDPNQDRWNGEIYGLAPVSSYTCDFVSTDDNSILFSTSVRTRAPQSETTANGVPASPQVAGRPGSPLTTLKTSIATSEIKLAEERARQKREKGDQKRKLNNVKKDLERLNHGISSSGGSDDRQRQKVHQANLHMKQAEEALENLTSQIASLLDIPAEDEKQYKSWKSSFQEAREIQKEKHHDFEAAKQSASEEFSSLESEITSIEQKCDKTKARIAKLQGELERITDANARGLDEAQRKAVERQKKEVERGEMESLLRAKLHSLDQDIEQITPSLRALINQVHVLSQAAVYPQPAESSLYSQTAEASMYLQTAEASMYSQPAEPSMYPQSNSPSSSATALAYNAPSSYPWNPTQPTGSSSNVANLYAPAPRQRGRSSSMLSNVSHFTQSSGEMHGLEPRFSLGPVGLEDYGRKDSSGSAGSTGDATSPGGHGNGKAPEHPWRGTPDWI